MELILPQPSAKQKLFLLDKHRHVAFGGAQPEAEERVSLSE